MNLTGNFALTIVIWWKFQNFITLWWPKTDLLQIAWNASNSDTHMWQLGWFGIKKWFVKWNHGNTIVKTLTLNLSIVNSKSDFCYLFVMLWCMQHCVIQECAILKPDGINKYTTQFLIFNDCLWMLIACHIEGEKWCKTYFKHVKQYLDIGSTHSPNK